MDCPACGSTLTRVRNTRGTRRYRACSACGHRWTTEEIEVANYHDWRAMKAERDRAVAEREELRRELGKVAREIKRIAG